MMTAFHQGLKEAGYVEGRNVAMNTAGHRVRTLPKSPLQMHFLHAQTEVNGD